MSNEELERWDSRYREGELPWDTGRPSSELQALLESGRVPVGTALDIGCGTGTNALFLAGRGFRVTAADLSPTDIEAAKRRATEAGLDVDFRTADLLASPPPDLGGPYDFLFDRGVYHVVRRIDVDAYLRLLEALSRPGTLYLSLMGNANEPHEPGPPTVSEEEVRRELGSVFELLDLRPFRFDPTPMVPDRPLGWSCLMRR